MSQRVRVFYSYSHKDEALRDSLEAHLSILKRQGLIEEWYDRRIVPGSDWESEISSGIDKADLVLFLVSSDFIASDYCYGREMRRALNRYEAGQARIVPVVVRPVDWQQSPIGRLQALPKDAKPITSWDNQDEAWLDVTKGIRRIIEEVIVVKKPTEASMSAFLSDLVKEEFERIDFRHKANQPTGGLPSGFIDLDRLTDGIHPNDIVLVAGSPLMGKSNFVLNIAAFLGITQKVGVVFFSLRLPLDSITRRLLSTEAEVSPFAILRGNLREAEIVRLAKAAGILGSSPIFFEGSPEIDQKGIEDAIHRAKTARKLGAIIVDGIESVFIDEGRGDNHLMSAMKMLRLISRKHNLPVILTLTLPSSRLEDKRPRVTQIDNWEYVAGDLANVVILLYRDIVYNPYSKEPHTTEVIVARNEHGPVGDVRLSCSDEYCRFANQYLE